MLESLQKYIVTPNKVMGVEVVLGREEQYYFNIVLLQKNKNQISIASQLSNILNQDDLYKALNQKVPLALTFTGRGIFHKKITSAHSSPEEALKAVLPDSNLNDFAYQVSEQAHINWLFLSRKDVIEAFINELTKRKFQIISIALGVAPVFSLLPLLKNSEKIITSQYLVETNSNEIINITSENLSSFLPTINIGTQQVNAHALLAFASAFQIFINAETPLLGFEGIKTYKNNYIYLQLFNKAGITFLLILFIILLANYIVFSWLNQQNAAMNVQLSYHQQQLHTLDSLQNQLNEQRTFLDENAVLTPSKISFYADRIGASLPQGIKLKEMIFFPALLSTKPEEEGKLLFDNEIINIKGASRESIILNNWIRSLKELSWIEDVAVLPYSEALSGVGDFEIQITIKN